LAIKKGRLISQRNEKIGVKNFPRKYDDLYFYEGENKEFYTNTGKIELYSTALEDEGFDPTPKFTKHPEPPDGFLSFDLWKSSDAYF